MLPPKPPKSLKPNYDEATVPWERLTTDLFRKTVHNYTMICGYAKDAPYGTRWHPDDIRRIIKAGVGVEEEVNKCYRWATKVHERGPRPTQNDVRDTIAYAQELCHKINAMVDDYELDVDFGPPRKNRDLYGLLADNFVAAMQADNAAVAPEDQDDFKIKGVGANETRDPANPDQDEMDYVQTLQDRNPVVPAPMGPTPLPAKPQRARTATRHRGTKDSWVRDRDGAPKRD
ncbi:hypothetical protein K491DRAFT_307929 [Lophiostoma macrostomum CBS 122681]|uniref:Uncharacterized protein n=1 Tax=Lophiostoma macrostomum CBS 122681 TaxID=1314788 RepID=A0A6A6TEP1_9PLEO|nr:hypothetical protein K491DRAFT_307929 [Lophiostoma macrostomum CBS 122681]